MHPFAATDTDLQNAKYAHVIGNPVKHSLSPKLHNAAYVYLHLPYKYSSLELTEQECRHIIAQLPFGEIFGLSFTMPYKELAFSLADQISPDAELSSAVNTLVFRNGEITGENTDIYGIRKSIELSFDKTEPWTILGTGATSRSAICALIEMGAEDIWVIGRNSIKLAELKKRYSVSTREFQQSFPTINLINTIPAVTKIELDLVTLPPKFLLDVNYSGWPTTLASAVAELGGITISGLDMLVHQAIKQIEIMVGQQVPPQALFDALTQ